MVGIRNTLIVDVIISFIILRDVQSNKTVINLATFLPKSGEWAVGKTIAPAAQLAADDINNDPNLLPDHVIKVSYHDTRCAQGKAILEIIRIFTGPNSVHGIIGDGCDVVCEPFGLLASDFQLPIISWGCSAIALSNKNQYGTFARTVGTRHDTFVVVMGLLHYFNWKRIGILASFSGTWEWLAQKIKTQLEVTEGGLVSDFHVFDAGKPGITAEERHHRKDVLMHIMLELRVVVICADQGDVRQVMLDALDLGLLNGDNVFIVAGVTSDAIQGSNSWMGDDGRDEDAHRALQGLLNIYITKPFTTKYSQFEERVGALNTENNADYALNDHIDVHAGMLYNSVLLYAHALQKALNNGYSASDGQQVARYMFNTSFEGVTGIVYIDEFGDGHAPYGLQVFDGDVFRELAYFSYTENIIVMNEGVQLLFPGGRSEVPLDHPPCGWNNELCARKSYVTPLAVTVAIIGVGILLAVGVVLMYRKLKFESEVNSEQLWRIKSTDLATIKATSSMSERIGSFTDTPIRRNNRLSTSNVSAGQDQIWFDVAIFKGIKVWLSMVGNDNLTVDRQLLVALKQMRDFHHENLNAFIGVCMDPQLKCLVTAYCSRGSLAGVLENDDIKITADFKLSFALDISKGMDFLHSTPIGPHGRLRSENCVVDNRWVCKITDFGLDSLRKHKTCNTDEQRYEALLWTAPELLRMQNPPNNGTKMGDVYSYAIILQEIVMRGAPYCMISGRNSRDIVQQVKGGLNPAFRPVIPSDACSKYMKALMIHCWDEIPGYRLSFSDIKQTFKEANSNKSMNILDNMIQMMEQYADNLEELVSERTQQLEGEKKKTDQLLYQMLPRSIAEHLKLGVAIHPEEYDRATVYFSDIVGFTKLASDSQPMEVINLLNDLYSTFDKIIDNYDVYKVETIGDAYMVVSGVPVKNGNSHAGEVASLSLDMLSSILSFKIKHMPSRQLRLRIGMHTGPVVAGVVGVKMPRYCLFGDTVNTASRMESTGQPLRIHMSKATMTVLGELGGYFVEERGEISIKGKGMLATYWLIGMEGFTKPLPDPECPMSPTSNDDAPRRS